jgi:hypothetical protein
MDKEFERPDWTPLERLVGNRCCEFMWMWREGGIEFYKHITTRRSLLLDSEGHCYRQTGAGLEAIDVAAELKWVRGDWPCRPSQQETRA